MASEVTIQCFSSLRNLPPSSSILLYGFEKASAQCGSRFISVSHCVIVETIKSAIPKKSRDTKAYLHFGYYTFHLSDYETMTVGIRFQWVLSQSRYRHRPRTTQDWFSFKTYSRSFHIGGAGVKCIMRAGFLSISCCVRAPKYGKYGQ